MGRSNQQINSRIEVKRDTHYIGLSTEIIHLAASQ